MVRGRGDMPRWSRCAFESIVRLMCVDQKDVIGEYQRNGGVVLWAVVWLVSGAVLSSPAVVPGCSREAVESLEKALRDLKLVRRGLSWGASELCREES